MASDNPTMEDYLRASDKYDVSDADKLPDAIRENINNKLGDLSE